MRFVLLAGMQYTISCRIGSITIVFRDDESKFSESNDSPTCFIASSYISLANWINVIFLRVTGLNFFSVHLTASPWIFISMKFVTTQPSNISLMDYYSPKTRAKAQYYLQGITLQIRKDAQKCSMVEESNSISRNFKRSSNMWTCVSR